MRGIIGPMDLIPRMRLMNWLVSQGLTGLPENDLLRGFCERCRAEGVDLSYGLVVIDTLHPIFEGRGFRWNDIEIDEADSFEYGSTDAGEPAQNVEPGPLDQPDVGVAGDHDADIDPAHGRPGQCAARAAGITGSSVPGVVEVIGDSH